MVKETVTKDVTKANEAVSDPGVVDNCFNDGVDVDIDLNDSDFGTESEYEDEPNDRTENDQNTVVERDNNPSKGMRPKGYLKMWSKLPAGLI